MSSTPHPQLLPSPSHPPAHLTRTISSSSTSLHIFFFSSMILLHINYYKYNVLYIITLLPNSTEPQRGGHRPAAERRPEPQREGHRPAAERRPPPQRGGHRPAERNGCAHGIRAHLQHRSHRHCCIAQWAPAAPSPQPPHTRVCCLAVVHPRST